MSLIKPSFVESLFHTFFDLDPDRMQYYNLVFRMSRSIFFQVGFNNKADELEKKIFEGIEKPFSCKLFSFLQAYYNPRFINSRVAFCKVGQGIDTKEITRYEMTCILEEIKNWCYDEITKLTPFIRFTRNGEAMA